MIPYTFVVLGATVELQAQAEGDVLVWGGEYSIICFIVKWPKNSYKHIKCSANLIHCAPEYNFCAKVM